MIIYLLTINSVIEFNLYSTKSSLALLKQMFFNLLYLNFYFAILYSVVNRQYVTWYQGATLIYYLFLFAHFNLLCTAMV